jgi:putative transcriptional regulator
MTSPAPPRSHPSEPTLLLFGAGRLGPAFRAAVAAHAAGCARCGALLRGGEALGGALLADEPPAALAPGALGAVLARLDDPAPPPGISFDALLAKRTWPVAPGVRHARLLSDNDESLHLFRVRPGASLPRHDHGGGELTCVLAGAFEDRTGVYAAGDAALMRPGLAHEPVAIGSAECVCLLAVAGRLRFATIIPRLVQRVLGL